MKFSTILAHPNKSAPVVAVLAALLTVLASSGRCQAAPAIAEPEYLVGVFCFSGWWREQPNKNWTAGHDWRTQWPERMALLGEYSDQETMDREILSAADHGVRFFQMLWYYQGSKVGTEPHMREMNSERVASWLRPEARAP